VGSVGSFSRFLVYLDTIIFLFYTELKCLLAPLLKTYPCEVERVEGVEGVNTTYSRAVALDLLAQRQVAFAQLRQQGVLVLDAPCDRISEELSDRYLQ
jgi:uncharacterized protein (DUF58 family)